MYHCEQPSDGYTACGTKTFAVGSTDTTMTSKRELTDGYDDPGFDRLIEQSSLGTTAAHRLSSQVSAAKVDKVRRLQVTESRRMGWGGQSCG